MIHWDTPLFRPALLLLGSVLDASAPVMPRPGQAFVFRYIQMLLDLIQNGTLDSTALLAHVEEMSHVVAEYEAFDRRRPG